MAKEYHIFRDPVHGFIKVNQLERKIIDSFPFQRLRNIKQLAFTYLVYPGAEHSRFSHSLGVMEFATKVFDAIVPKHKKELKWDDDRIQRNRQLLRIVALLHDLGHAPFSHASEELFNEEQDHELYTLKIIKSSPIKDIIDEFSPKIGADTLAEDIVDFFTAGIKADIAFLKEIYSGEVDVDKMDYLLRDSLFLGVHYGKFDYERLINTLCLIKNPDEEGSFVLAIEEGGIHALEALVLARYFMFTQVYFHRVRRVYDLHLVEFLKKALGKYPDDIQEFLEWDDVRVIQLMRDNIKDDNGQRILKRNHFVEVFSTPEHSTEAERLKFMWLKEKSLKKFKSKKLLFDEAEKAPHKFREIDFYVKKRGGKPVLVTKASGIINNLQRIQQYRIYARREDQSLIRSFCEEFWT